MRRGGRDAVRAALVQARERTLGLARDYAAALGDAPAIPYAAQWNPPLWELGHVAWFQEWWIARNPQRGLGVDCDPDAPRRGSVLAHADRWYDSSRVVHRSRWELDLPDAPGTHDFLRRTLAATLSSLDELPEQPGDTALYFYRLVALHEQMHAEAATYMARGLGVPLAAAGDSQPMAPHRELLLEAQDFRLGADPQGFAFDNELGAHRVRVGPAWIDSQAVSWARFLPFVEAGGYEDASWWTEEGAQWLGRAGRRAPEGLRCAGGGWQHRGPAGWTPLQLGAAAVHLNAHEAQAWCRWAGRRLLTEAEWECAAHTLPGFSWGSVWEWTASTFTPYPGFVPHPYRDYSQPWFGSRHVLRGACAATSPALSHARYRNFFEPHRSDVFAGFRSSRA
ncbi:MAG: hypothetical protein JWP41_4687 [Ramlibacter sp.]|nr:hypothetical protein [Ramlibacter sp.]